MHAGLSPAHQKTAGPFIVAVGGTTRNGSSRKKVLRIALSQPESLGAETVLLGAEDLLLTMDDPAAPKRTPAAKRLVKLLRRADGGIVTAAGWPTPVGDTINTAAPSFDNHGQCLSSSAAAQLAPIGRQVLDFAQKEHLTRALMLASSEPEVALSL